MTELRPQALGCELPVFCRLGEYFGEIPSDVSAVADLFPGTVVLLAAGI